MKRRIVGLCVVSYAILNVVETIAGAGAIIIVFGEMIRWWDVL